MLCFLPLNFYGIISDHHRHISAKDASNSSGGRRFHFMADYDLSFFLISHPFASIIRINDPTVFKSILFQQVLHDLIIPVCVYF